MSRSILIVDDDARIRTSLAQALKEEASVISVAEDGSQALAALAKAPIDLIITDVRMPEMDGMELLRVIRERAPDTSVILMTAFDDLPTIATAMREGAADFLVKPLDLHALRGVVRRIFEDRRLRDRATPPEATRLQERLIGHDPEMIEIFKIVGQVAATRANVLIRGESGTGKELIARAIHSSSSFSDEPFVPVNCTALPSTLLESELFGHVRGAFTGAASDRRGRFALAGDGTIFLDEIGDTSLDFQSKLLRVLQEHEYYPVGAERPERTWARVVAATHRELEALVASGEFRQDLYYRLRVVEIRVPPLRDRLGDVPALAEHLVRKVSDTIGRDAPVLAAETIDALTRHRWPGNVRELENCLTRAVVQAPGGVIRPEHVALWDQPGASAARLTSLEEVEREHVAQVLTATKGHKSRAAEILGISRPRLDRLIGKYGLDDLAPGRSGEDAGTDSPEG
jgi:two-component system NtrC family response regulator